MAAPKRWGEIAIKNRARPQETGDTTTAAINLAPGDTAWNPHGADITDAPRVIYHFHANGDVGVMVMTEMPPFM